MTTCCFRNKKSEFQVFFGHTSSTFHPFKLFKLQMTHNFKPQKNPCFFGGEFHTPASKNKTTASPPPKKVQSSLFTIKSPISESIFIPSTFLQTTPADSKYSAHGGGSPRERLIPLPKSPHFRHWSKWRAALHIDLLYSQLSTESTISTWKYSAHLGFSQ